MQLLQHSYFDEVRNHVPDLPPYAASLNTHRFQVKSTRLQRVESVSIHKAAKDGSLAFFDKTLLEKRPSQLDMKLSIPAIFAGNSSKPSTTESEVSVLSSRKSDSQSQLNQADSGLLLKERAESNSKGHNTSQHRNKSRHKTPRRSISHQSVSRHRSISQPRRNGSYRSTSHSRRHTGSPQGVSRYRSTSRSRSMSSHHRRSISQSPPRHREVNWSPSRRGSSRRSPSPRERYQRRSSSIPRWQRQFREGFRPYRSPQWSPEYSSRSPVRRGIYQDRRRREDSFGRDRRRGTPPPRYQYDIMDRRRTSPARNRSTTPEYRHRK